MFKVCVLTQGDDVMHKIMDVFTNLHDAMVAAASTPSPDPQVTWKRDIDADGNVVWSVGKNWMRVEEKILR